MFSSEALRLIRKIKRAFVKLDALDEHVLSVESPNYEVGLTFDHLVISDGLIHGDRIHLTDECITVPEDEEIADRSSCEATTLFLYKLTSPSHDKKHGCYVSCIVVAVSEAAARLIHPDGSSEWDETQWNAPRSLARYPTIVSENALLAWDVPGNIQVNRLGELQAKLTVGTVVCAEFKP